MISKPYEHEYDPKYGENKICTCGHPYYRHFDTYEDMEPVGCKYCGDRCDGFLPANPAQDGYPALVLHEWKCPQCRESWKGIQDTVVELDRLTREYEKLKEQYQRLMQTNANLYKQISGLNAYYSRKSHYDQDYLPYEDNNYD